MAKSVMLCPQILNENPRNNLKNCPRRLLLAVDLRHPAHSPMDVTFEINNHGWQKVKSLRGVGEGSYDAGPIRLDDYSTTYSWRVIVSDGVNTVRRTYLFTTESRAVYLGLAYCFGVAWAARSDRNKSVFYIGWEEHPLEHNHEQDHYIWYREYHRNLGWLEPGNYVFKKLGIDNEQSACAYWEDKYWFLWVDSPRRRLEVLSGTWEDLPRKSMEDSELICMLDSGWLGKFPCIYSFGNDKGWVVAEVKGLRYWEWTSETNSWRGPCFISSMGGRRPRVLPIDKKNICIYVDNHGVRYVKSEDGGETWGRMINTGIPSDGETFSICRYGDVFFLITYDNQNGITLRSSHDGETWSNRVTIYNGNPLGYFAPELILLDEETLLWSATEKDVVDPCMNGWRNHYAGTFTIPTLHAALKEPDTPIPQDGAVLSDGCIELILQVSTHSSDTMDVAFYWADGTFIGVDKLVKPGENAIVQIGSLLPNRYAWYAVVRGTTSGYWGEPDSSPDEKSSPIWHFTIQPSSKPYVFNETPAKGAKAVPTSLEHLSFEIMDHSGRLLDYEVTTNPEIAGKSETGRTNGRQVLPVSNFKPSTTYKWRVKVTNGKEWAEKEYQFTTACSEPTVAGLVPENGATGIPITFSQLGFELIHPQDRLIDFSIVTSPDVGSYSRKGAISGMYSFNIQNLRFNTTYTWRVHVDDGINNTNKTYTFRTEPPPPSRLRRKLSRLELIGRRWASAICFYLQEVIDHPALLGNRKK